MLIIYLLVEITDDFLLLYTLLKNFCVYICIMCGENSDCISFFIITYFVATPPPPPPPPRSQVPTFAFFILTTMERFHLLINLPGI